MKECDNQVGDPDRRESISCGAVVFAQTKATFSARDFAYFLRMGGIAIEDERADDVLSDLVDQKSLRRIGPGLYAASVSA